MTITQIPWPVDELYFTIEVKLGPSFYALTAQWIEAGEGSSWCLSLATAEGVVIESGMRLVAGAQLAWRGATGLSPEGVLTLASYGNVPVPDVPTIGDMQSGAAVLVYDDTI